MIDFRFWSAIIVGVFGGDRVSPPVLKGRFVMAYVEMSDRECDRIDFVENEIYDLVNRLLPEGREVAWDLDMILNIKDAIWDNIEDKNVCTEQEFFPYRDVDDDENGL